MSPVSRTFSFHAWGAPAVAATAIYASMIGLGLAQEGPVSAPEFHWLTVGTGFGLLARFGPRWWPLVLIGNIAAGTALIRVSPTAVEILGLGDTLAAFLGALFLWNAAPFDRQLDRLRHVAVLAVASLGIAAAVSAGFDSATECVLRLVSFDGDCDRMWLQWLSTGAGAMVIAPFVLAWTSRSALPIGGGKPAEAAALVPMTLLLAALVFRPFAQTEDSYPLAFLALPLVTWAAIRFGMKGATASILAFSFTAIASTARGWGPFALSDATISVAILWSFVAVLALTGIVLAAISAERQAMVAALRRSEAWFQAFFDHAPTRMLIKDREGRYLKMSRSIERTLGIDTGSALGKTADQVYPVGFAHKVAEDDKTVLATGQPMSRERLLNDRGNQRSVLDVRFPILDAAGRPEALGVVSTDITELRQAQAALEESERRFQTIADTVPALLWMSDDKRNYIFVNRVWSEYTGRPAEEAFGKGFASRLHPDDLDNADAVTADSLGHQGEWSVDYRLRGADGGYRWFLDTWRPRFDADGRFLGQAGVLVDIEERRHLEQALLKAKQEAEIANRTKSQFLANMSHELRTPLNAIIGFSEMIGKEIHGPIGVPKYRDYAVDVQTSGQHLLALVSDLLDTAKIEAGKFDFVEVECGLAAIVAEGISMVSARARAGELTIETRFEKNLPRLRADRRALLQILLNLLSNAVKFTQAGGRITVSAADTAEGGIEIAVSDTGIGIAPKDLPRIFQAFTQFDSALSRSGGGTGLGLHLTKALIEAHQGSVAVESTKDVGTTIRVRFPAARCVRIAA